MDHLLGLTAGKFRGRPPFPHVGVGDQKGVQISHSRAATGNQAATNEMVVSRAVVVAGELVMSNSGAFGLGALGWAPSDWRQSDLW